MAIDQTGECAGGANSEVLLTLCWTAEPAVTRERGRSAFGGAGTQPVSRLLGCEQRRVFSSCRAKEY